MLGLLLEHLLWVLFAKPLAAALFLIVNGLILLAGERYRKRAAVRELAAKEGRNQSGGRQLDTLQLREAAVAAVHFLSRHFRRGSLCPFGIYCLLAGAGMSAFTVIFGAP